MGTTFVLEPDAARERIRRGAKVELDYWLACLWALKAEAELAGGDWTAAAQHATAVLRADVGGPARCGALRVLALVRARRGDPEVWPLLAEALDLARESDDLRLVAPVAAARAEVAWLEGRADDAVEEMREAFERALAEGEAFFVAELAGWRRRAGVAEPGPEVDPAGPYEAALALAGSGDVDRLRRAFDELRALGAHRAAALVARRLAERGVRGLPRGPHAGTRANPAGLTPRQLEVLTLISQGLRNAEISERLVVSAKTVDHHVSAILRKLNVSTRTAAAYSLRLAA
jgi:DNA-binding CsgD family transcriptional regulator